MPSYADTEARRVAYEARYVPRIRRELVRQGEVAAAAYASGATPELAAALVKSDGLMGVLNGLYEDVGVAFARGQYDELTPTKSVQVKKLPGANLLSGIAARLRRFFSGEGTVRAQGMVRTTRDIVKDVIAKAQADGLSVPDTAKRLRAEITTLSQARAVVIARTELVAASNLGSLLGAQATGLKLNMRWLATPGSRTRDTHRAADGQTVPLGGTFTVGGHPARYPGDPLLPARECVNCRCSLVYAPI